MIHYQPWIGKILSINYKSVEVLWEANKHHSSIYRECCVNPKKFELHKGYVFDNDIKTLLD